MRQANRLISIFIALLPLAACHAPSADSAQSGANIPAAASAAANPDIPLKADLPIFWQGVPDLLHPIVVSAADEYAEKSYSSKTVKSHIDVSDYELSGNLFNLVFENMETGAKQPLFPHNNQMILHAKYLISQPENNSRQNADSSAAPRFYRHLVYQVREAADREDAPLSLYLSDEHGQNRQKLHPNGEFVIGTRWLPETDRYYFTTKSDSNGDGKIGLADQPHNYYIDFKEIDHPKIHVYDLMPK